MTDINVEILNQSVSVETSGNIGVDIVENQVNVTVENPIIQLNSTPTVIEVDTNEQGPAGIP